MPCALRLLYFEAGSQTPQTCPIANCEERFEPKGQVTVLLIARQLSNGLAVNEDFTLSRERAVQMRLIDEGQI